MKLLAFFIAFIITSSSLNANEKLTLGKVQLTLKKGMSQAEIIQSLGSPNMVTMDAKNNETWIYDKLSTEVNSNSKNKKKTVLGGIIGGVVGVGGAYSSKDKSSSETTSQKTLTVVMKFKEKKLDNFTYNVSKF